MFTYLKSSKVLTHYVIRYGDSYCTSTTVSDHTSGYLLDPSVEEPEEQCPGGVVIGTFCVINKVGRATAKLYCDVYV